MMRNATSDLLRLILTASAVVGFLLYANFEAARVVPPRGDAMARVDSIRGVRTISEDGMTHRPEIVPTQDVEPDVAAPAGSVAKDSGKPRTLVALAQ